MTSTKPPGRPIAMATPPKLDALYQFIADHYIPPFYETPTERECAAFMGYSQPYAHKCIELLVKQERLLKSGTGKVVPAPK